MTETEVLLKKEFMILTLIIVICVFALVNYIIFSFAAKTAQPGDEPMKDKTEEITNNYKE